MRRHISRDPAAYLNRCFGRATCRDNPKAWICPASCKALCWREHFDPRQAPRIECGVTEGRPFTPVLNSVLRDWGIGSGYAGMRHTYLALVSFTADPGRVVWASAPVIAEEAGIEVPTLYDHARMLAALRLIRKVSRAALLSQGDGKSEAYIVRNLPAWFRLPRPARAAAVKRLLSRARRSPSAPGHKPAATAGAEAARSKGDET